MLGNRATVAAIVAAMEDGIYHARMKEKMAGLEEERQRLTRLLATHAQPTALRLHPRISDI